LVLMTLETAFGYVSCEQLALRTLFTSLQKKTTI